MWEWARSSAEAMHVEYAAEEPSPAEMGKFDDAVNVAAGLSIGVSYLASVSLIK